MIKINNIEYFDQEELEQKALDEYKKHLGKIIVLNDSVRGEKNGSFAYWPIGFDEIKARVIDTPEHQIIKFNGDWLDSIWNLELINPTEDMKKGNNFWTYGTSYNINYSAENNINRTGESDEPLYWKLVEQEKYMPKVRTGRHSWLKIYEHPNLKIGLQWCSECGTVRKGFEDETIASTATEHLTLLSNEWKQEAPRPCHSMDLIKKLVRRYNNEKRLQLFEALKQAYCFNCGRPGPGCDCQKGN